ncbi:hypothetical protein F8M41_024768 [Gigaspora margarita]|uniref:Uncharacterized protein n=1 Tax=Gigaspora margarita TaxID=4874 RepID=A0A8H3XJR5_GIGMA|nr:hypothetical protein F8M41_024768 [Gigaspora margarita]
MNISQQHMSIILPSEQLSAQEFSLSSGEEVLLTNNNNARSNIDANTEMDEQTADQILTNLQSNYWHDTLREMSQGNSSRNQ